MIAPRALPVQWIAPAVLAAALAVAGWWQARHMACRRPPV